MYAAKELGKAAVAVTLIDPDTTQTHEPSVPSVIVRVGAIATVELEWMPTLIVLPLPLGRNMRAQM